MQIVDRRLNPGGRSLANRQRFLHRAKDSVQRAVREGAKDRDIKGLDQPGEISIPAGGVAEPNFRRDHAGATRNVVLPGNRDFVEGDTIPRPKGGGGGGSSGGSGSASEDAFQFVLTREEFLDLFLEDLELPDLDKSRVLSVEKMGLRRAGYTNSGSPSNLSLTRTLRISLARRIALKRPKAEDLDKDEQAIAALSESDAGDERLPQLREDFDRMRRHSRRVPYLDPFDLRYRRFEPVAKPATQAVMFCLMDVSGSMTDHMKDLAKRFFMLLHVFLARRYSHVDLVFIRHTDEAREVDEETFFTSRETGGTRVSSALAEMRRIVDARYNVQDWNIYAAQASDGDNASADNEGTARLLTEAILPVCQYFAYIEVGADHRSRVGFAPPGTALWRTYAALLADGAAITMRRVGDRRDIYPVFRDLFRRRGAGAETVP
jgi:uncharacterized sporulation protein YeaH/YhbH (DUF444 family)